MRPFSRFCARCWRFAAAVFVLCAATACFASAFMPVAAHADTYSLPQVNVQAQVAENGDLYVTEARTFSFEDEVNGVFWTIPFARNQQGASSYVQVLDVYAADAPGEQSEAELRRSARAFSLAPRAEEGDADVYTTEEQDGALTLKVFTPHGDGDTAVVWVSYVVYGAVMAWQDTGELYWKYVGDAWEEDADNVQLTVTFAGAASGTPASTGADGATLRAWGHGSYEGEVALDVSDPQAPYVALSTPRVQAGQFAEVRVAFPLDWVPDLNVAGGERLDTMIAEETAWAEQANAERERARAIVVVGTAALTGASAVLLAVSLVVRRKFQSPKPVFEETYFRDVPSTDHPAVLSALEADGSVEDRAFIATLMKLTDDRVIQIGHEMHAQDRLFGLGEKQVDRYTLTLVAFERVDNEIDRAAVELYFGRHAANGDEVAFDGFGAAGEDDGATTTALMDDFKAEVTATLEERNLTDRAPGWFKHGVGLAGVVLVVAIVLFFVLTDGASLTGGANWLFLLLGLVLAIGAAAVAGSARQYTQECVELRVRCAALKKWLEDFTNLDEAVPADVVLWNKMLVLAVAFGVSEEVLRQLADAVPDGSRIDANGGYFYPSYWWLYPHGRLHAPVHEMHKTYAATISELASSSDSSESGFGGGFSGGGGGGVGGGGGGTF